MAHSGSLNISEEKNLIHSTADGVNEFQLLREAWRNAAQASSTVKCANWKLPENPTLAFKHCWLQPNVECMGRRNRRRHLETLWKCFFSFGHLWGYTQRKQWREGWQMWHDIRKMDQFNNYQIMSIWYFEAASFLCQVSSHTCQTIEGFCSNLLNE